MNNCYIIRDEEDARIAISQENQMGNVGNSKFICIRPGALVNFDPLQLDPSAVSIKIRYVDLATQAALEAKKLQERRLAGNILVVVRAPIIDRAERALVRFGISFRVLGRPECARLC